MDIYHDQVIEAAYLHTKPGCFYIGPFARRVSFASQQYRALDLVAALAEKGKLTDLKSGKGKKVAVIGAGIAGLTAATALRGQGCKVHLYERSKAPLLLQKDASHRLIHPTISRWPVGDLQLTTSFPFLDWFAAPCDRVIASMRQEWEERLKPKPRDRSFHFYPEVTVKGLKAEDDTVSLVIETERTDLTEIQKYDYVFVTTGYADEEGLGGRKSISYWTEDQIEAWRKDQRQVYISGCGDGGLIDALRLVHADFDRGWLAVRLAEILTRHLPAKTIEEIRDAEHQALMAAKSLACMDLTATPGSGEAEQAPALRKLGARYENLEIVTRLTNFYRDLVKVLPPPAKGLLESSLKKANVANGRVVLISRQVQPFGPYAAPIHKIMVQHARFENRITYAMGELSDDGSESRITMMSSGETVTVTDDMGLVVRHGSQANLQGLAGPGESGSLKIRQFMLADYIDTKTPRRLPAPKGYPDLHKRDERGRYIGVRWPMVKELVDTLFPGTTVTATVEGYFYEHPVFGVTGRDPVGIAMPEEAFGIPLAPTSLATSELFDA